LEYRSVVVKELPGAAERGDGETIQGVMSEIDEIVRRGTVEQPFEGPANQEPSGGGSGTMSTKGRRMSPEP
jgi:hypothetical protein